MMDKAIPKGLAMKFSFRLSVTGLFFLSAACFAEDFGGPGRDYNVRSLEAMTRNGADKIFNIDESVGQKLLNLHNQGFPIADDLIVKKIVDKSDWVKHTYGGNNGPKVVEQFPDFKNGQLSYFPKTLKSNAEAKQWATESEGCVGQLNFGEHPKQDKRISKCFEWLDKLKIIAFPETGPGNTYLKGLMTVTSVIDGMDGHQCMASVYKKDIWVTARHCLIDKDDALKSLVERRFLIVGGKRREISNSVVTPCSKGGLKSSCDVAFIKMDTGAIPDSELPMLDYGKDFLNRDTKLLMPGLAVGEDLAEKYKPAIYRQELLWSAYGKGFCRAMEVETNGCMIHTCSALLGFSGAPIYSYDESSERIVLIGIHSGTSPQKNECADNSGASYAQTLAKGMPL